jgi:cytochrome b-561
MAKPRVADDPDHVEIPGGAAMAATAPLYVDRRPRARCCDPGAGAVLGWVLLVAYAKVALALVACVAAFVGLWTPFGLKYLPVDPPVMPYPNGLNTSPVFAFHPVLFTVAYAALMGSALLAFSGGATAAAGRGPTTHNRLWRKRAHSALHALAGVFIGLGLAAVFTSQKAAGRPLFYTGHSWVGMGSVGLYALNFAGGLSTFLLPCASPAARKAMLPVHNFLGWLAFGTGMQAIASGIEELRVLIMIVYVPAGAVPAANVAPILLLMPLAQVLLAALIAVALAHAMLSAAGRQRAALAEAAAGGAAGGSDRPRDGAADAKVGSNGDNGAALLLPPTATAAAV